MISPWRDAQHQYEGIAQRLLQRSARRVAADMAATAAPAATRRTRPRRIHPPHLYQYSYFDHRALGGIRTSGCDLVV